VSVNAAIPENQERAYLVRMRDAMNDLGVPEVVQRQVREHTEAETHPRARTLVLFAAEDGFLEDYRLQVDVPESFRWGDPNVAPLTLVMDEYEPYGAAVLDAERFRYFVVSPLARPQGDEEVKANGFREVDLRPSQPYPRSHGSTDADPAGRTQQAKAHRFYKEMGELARDVTFREGVRRLILAGPREVTAAFRDALPNELKDRVVAEEPIELGAPEGEILDRLEAIREQAEHEREKELLAEIRERGVRGPDETIAALQEENRVYHLAALWDLDRQTTDRRPRGSRRRPRRPPGLHARRERTYRHPARRVRGHRRPHPLLSRRAATSRWASAGSTKKSSRFLKKFHNLYGSPTYVLLRLRYGR
jgi:hypothetical protein